MKKKKDGFCALLFVCLSLSKPVACFFFFFVRALSGKLYTFLLSALSRKMLSFQRRPPMVPISVRYAKRRNWGYRNYVAARRGFTCSAWRVISVMEDIAHTANTVCSSCCYRGSIGDSVTSIGWCLPITSMTVGMCNQGTTTIGTSWNPGVDSGRRNDFSFEWDTLWHSVTCSSVQNLSS